MDYKRLVKVIDGSAYIAVVCSDMIEYWKSRGRISKFPNGTSLRDLTGEVEFPVRGR